MFGNRKKTLYVALPSARERAQQENKIGVSAYLVAVLFFLVILMGYLLYRYEGRVKELEVTSPVSAQDEMARVVTDVGAVYVLPPGEVPVLATVGDTSKLPDQPFFREAQSGDEVLMFMKSKKAILWRPSIKKIVEVGPLSIKQPNNGVIEGEGAISQ